MLPNVTSDDILEFGLIPELVGRLPVTTALSPLNTDAMMRVLTEPKNALTRQYERLFAMEEKKRSGPLPERYVANAIDLGGLPRVKPRSRRRAHLRLEAL